jgi:hypothetical protein
VTDPIIVKRVAELVGAETLVITDGSSRWPALGELNVDGKTIPVALYLSAVTLSHRDRDEVERRFQNPASGHAITSHLPGRKSLLLGLWDSGSEDSASSPVLVSADPLRREGLQTRYSVFVRLADLTNARDHGWAESTTSTGETLRCFSPALLASAFAAADFGITAPLGAVQAAINGSGLLDTPIDDQAAAGERARRATFQIIRNSRFARDVLEAYDQRCAMCGLGAGLVEGAHIYPASAPGSPDQPWNGLALCANHHAAFDDHIVAVQPHTRLVVVHQTLLQESNAHVSDASVAFVETTFPKLADPVAAHASPQSGMFEKRYSFYLGSYDWI